ncbi:FMRFamide receptor-like [Oppia nitens]|uniref:FMRFamide receptor-like n=1 Tax=Oppia nitens TaxID=1686743 RepID=UPI0023D9D64B|nr:FMRFamide receptor-like [Oppia nitens]
MRKQSINIYLTVLALYDNGVLIFGILMLSVPALHINPNQMGDSTSPTISTGEDMSSSMPLNEHLDIISDTTNSTYLSYISQKMLFYFVDNSDDCMDFNVNEDNKPNYQYHNPLQYYIRIVYPLALISQTGSIWTTCLITVERYLAVCHPLRSLTLSTRSRAIWALTALSIGAFVYNLPRFAEIDMTEDSVRQSDLRKSKLYYWFYYIVLNLSLIYIIPLTLLSVLNTKIYLSVRIATANRTELTRARQRELNLASMLTLLVAIFIACNAPAFVINCLELIKPDYLAVPTMFSNVLVCLNSAINFLIYCIFGKKFREKLKEVFKCRYRKKLRKSSANRQHYYFGGSCAADTFV